MRCDFSFDVGMSDDAAANPAVPAGTPSAQPPCTHGPDQLPALRAARAVLKQQLKTSTQEIRKEARFKRVIFVRSTLFGSFRFSLFPLLTGLGLLDLKWHPGHNRIDLLAPTPLQRGLAEQPSSGQVRRRSRLMKKASGLSTGDVAWLLARRAE